MARNDLLEQLSTARGKADVRRLADEHRAAFDASLVDDLKAEVDRLERSDPRRALGVARVACHTASVLADPVALASALWGRANALRALGKYRPAIRLYDQAAAIFGSNGRPVDAARTQIGKVDALMYQGAYDDAITAAAAARRTLARHREWLQVAKLDANTGNVYHRLDRYADALRLYDRARRILARLGQDAFVAHVDVNRANVFTHLNRFRQASSAYEHARQVFESAGLRLTVAMIDANVGYLHLLQGNYNQALVRLTAARSTFEELGVEKNAAVVNLDLAEVYLSLNLLDDAVELLDQSRPRFQRLEMRAEAARALALRAIALTQLGQYPLALNLFAEAQQGFAAEGNRQWSATIDLHQAILLYALQSSTADLEQALLLCRRAHAVFAADGVHARRGYAELIEGRILLAQDDRDNADRLLRAALATANRYRLTWLSYQCLHALGSALEADDPAEAERLYRAAIGELEAMWQDLQPEDLKTAFFQHRLQVYEDLVLLCLNRGDRGRRDAFAFVERAKSRALVELLAGRLDVRLRGGKDDLLVAQLQALREELNWYYNRLSQGDGKSDQRNPTWAAELTSEVQRRESRLTTVVRRLQVRQADYAALQQVSGCTVEEVQALLPADATLVEYFISGDEILAFVVDRRGLWVERGLALRPAVAGLADKLRFHLGKFDFGREYVGNHLPLLCRAMDQYLGRLYDALIRPLAPRLRGQRLIVVPHGPLHYLPFHAFFDGEEHLLDRFDVSYSPSASVLRSCRQRQPNRNSRALVLAVPDDWAPRVRDEAAALGQMMPDATIRIGAAATGADLRSLGPQHEYVHIASHAMFSQTNPMFSRFRLADGWVNVHDVYNLSLDASLVTLSACETGMNRVAPGDELIGLARGFFYAGARSLVLSLWSVNDASTAQLMTRFYAGVLAGKPPVVAMREAQCAIRDEYVHAYYWAPFVVLGAGD